MLRVLLYAALAVLLITYMVQVRSHKGTLTVCKCTRGLLQITRSDSLLKLNEN